MVRVFNFFGGRCTTFAIVFTAGGIWLALRGELTGTYIALVGAIQSLILAHSWKEDFYAKVNDDRSRTNSPVDKG